jgi:hypothetical protein
MEVGKKYKHKTSTSEIIYTCTFVAPTYSVFQWVNSNNIVSACVIDNLSVTDWYVEYKEKVKVKVRLFRGSGQNLYTASAIGGNFGWGKPDYNYTEVEIEMEAP